MTAEEAMAFVREQGVVLVSGKGAVPRLTEAIVGEPVKGSWWAHPKSHQIFAILQAVTDSKEILVCRLVDGKVTLVHRRLWPALVRVAGRFRPDQIAQVREEHMPSGRHATRVVAFPKWVPAEIEEDAKQLSEPQALAALGPWTQYLTRRSSRRAENGAPLSHCIGPDLNSSRSRLTRSSIASGSLHRTRCSRQRNKR